MKLKGFIEAWCFCLIHGIVEWWNNGMLVLKRSFSFLNISNLRVNKKTPNKPISHFSSFNIVRDKITQYSSIPIFQYSNWGVAPKFLDVLERKTLLKISPDSFPVLRRMMVMSIRLKVFVLCVVVTALFGCQIWADKTVPEEVSGVWETSAPRYVDSTFELKDEMIIFTNGMTYVNVNFITDIKQSPEKDKTLFVIYFENKEGLEYQRSFYYYKGQNGGMIRFKNQMNVEWTKKE